MTIADVAEFYIRRDVLEASGTETTACTGCFKPPEAGTMYSNYDIKPGSPAKLPAEIILCQKCAYIVIGFGPMPPRAT
jgi:hypothetical protein